MRVSPGLLLRFLLALVSGVTALAPARAQNDAASRREAIDLMYPVMISALETKNFSRARKICDQVILWEPQNPVHHYNLACIEAQAGGPRLPYALGALDLSIALGFDDVDHLKTDPDLVPLHGDPKFADLVRKAGHNASADAAIAAITIPGLAARPRTTVEPAFEQPAPAAFQQGLPVGLYLMNRYQSATRVAEKEAWYFSPDGSTYRNLAYGFSRADLAAHTGPTGRASSDGGRLKVTWTDGSTSVAEVEREGRGFTWDQGIFTPVEGFNQAGDVAGSYEGGDEIVRGPNPGGNRRLDLNPDGSFTWSGISIIGSTAVSARLQSSPGQNATGQWTLQGYSLILVGVDGSRLRGLTFPVDDPSTVMRPDWLFLGGTMLKRRP